MEMNEMTVHEILEKKIELEQNIEQMIRDFNANVYKIYSVNVDYYESQSGKIYQVDVEVLL
jgi:hypothetical protein